MNINNINLLSEKCTGCAACYSICPASAIEMKFDEEGFLFPIIHDDKCINCGKCYNVCQINKSYPTNNTSYKVAAYVNDALIRSRGSSGGIVALLSKYTKSHNGVVYGAVFDSANKKIIHQSSNAYDLKQLSKSKYVQSDLGLIFKEVLTSIKLDKQVLFCGTPCQIIGLKEFLGKEYPNLLTIDFFCHGVPSPGYFNNMLENLESINKSEISNITFREKDYGWRNQYIKFYFKNGNVMEQKSSDFNYYFYFLNNYSLRKSCYDCDKYNKHLSDITVADFWQIDKDFDDDKGVSLIFENTSKGKNAIKIIEDNLTKIELNKPLDISYYSHKYTIKNRKKFFKMYRKHGYEYMANTFFYREKYLYKRRIKRKNKINSIKKTIKSFIKA